ncbi:MAG: branched-chain amino acid transport system substrate-binding protein [Solirubrobacterales bacterium]|jgi:branched-chain amino acid transport system substrate-binding protein|nr:branched-chain amino acid transport system substrate-binding protein [Solirubrobacterales bacterium]
MSNKFRRGNVRVRLVAAAGVLLFVTMALGACGGGGSSSSGSTGESSSDSSTSAENLPPGALQEEATGSPVKVGLIVDEGGQQISQPEAREAAEAAIDYSNEQLNGIAGHKIELLVCQTKEETSAAADCANQMVQAGVVGVMVTSTGQGGVMVPIISEAGISYSSPVGVSTQEYTEPNSFVYTSALPGSYVAKAAYAHAHGLKSVTLFLIDAGSFVATAEAIAKPAFEAEGVEVNLVAVPPGTPDATPQVNAGLQSNPEAISIEGPDTFCIAVIKALETAGTTAENWMGDPCIADDVISAVSPEFYEGAINFTTTDGSTEDPEAQAYRWAMSKFAPEAPIVGGSALGYQSASSFVRVATQAKGEVTAESVRKAFLASKNIKLGIGHGLSFTCNRKNVPGAPAICGKGYLAATLNSKAEVTKVESLK